MEIQKYWTIKERVEIDVHLQVKGINIASIVLYKWTEIS